MATKNFKVNNGLTTPNVVLEETGGNTVTLQANTNSANYILTLPVNDGNNGQYLQTDGSGNLEWVTLSAGSIIANGNSNVSVLANSVVLTSSNGQANIVNVYSNGTHATTTFADDILVTANIRTNSNTIALGNAAGSTGQGDFSIAIGYGAAVTNQPNNSIILNASGSNINPSTANALYFNPVRKESNALAISNVANVGIVTWDSTTSELRQGSPIFTYAQENLTIVASAPSATTNFDILSNSIAFYTSNATTDVTLNFRGNGSTTANSLLAVGQSITCTFIMTVGATQYTVSAVQIDGSAVTPKYVNNITPAAESNVRNSLTYTIIKTDATPTYVVLGAQTLYGY